MSLVIHAINTVEMDIVGLEQIFLYGGTLGRSVADGPLRPYAYRDSIELPSGLVGDGMLNPAVLFLIEGGEKRIVVETGVSPENVETFNTCCERYGIKQFYRHTDEHDIEDRLRERGVTPDMIDIVIPTHLHPDHSSNGGMFTKATIVTQHDSLPWALSPPPWAPYFWPEFRHYYLDVLDRVKLIEGHQEIIEGVEVWKTGGHVPGHQIVTVETAKGTVVMTGDIVLNYRHLEMDWPMGTYWSGPEVFAAYQLIREKADIVLPSHDFELWDRHPDGFIG